MASLREAVGLECRRKLMIERGEEELRSLIRNLSLAPPPNNAVNFHDRLQLGRNKGKRREGKLYILHDI